MALTVDALYYWSLCCQYGRGGVFEGDLVGVLVVILFYQGGFCHSTLEYVKG